MYWADFNINNESGVTALQEILTWNRRIVKLLYSSDRYWIHSFLQYKNTEKKKKKLINAFLKTFTSTNFNQGEIYLIVWSKVSD